MSSPYREGVYILANIADLSLFQFPNVRPGRPGNPPRSFDVHRETSQNNYRIALCDEFFGFKFDDVLDFGHLTEELRDPIASVPDARKRNVCDLGHFPSDIGREYVQKRLSVARLKTVIRPAVLLGYELVGSWFSLPSSVDASHVPSAAELRNITHLFRSNTSNKCKVVFRLPPDQHWRAEPHT
jgi:hypothetical protein